MSFRIFLPLASVLTLIPVCTARQSVNKVDDAPAGFSEHRLSKTRSAEVSNYVLGPDDQLLLLVSDAEEISGKPVRIDLKGDINLPMAGRIHAADLTPDQLEVEIARRLKRFLQNPEVVVSVTEFRSQPISVLGAVGNPGIHQVQGHKTLFEVLSSAGGLRQDAGNTVNITRNLKWGPIPLPSAKQDATGKFSTASVSIKSVMAATNPRENITIKPEDVISVPRADLVYVIGAVHKPGGFVLAQNESLSALQVLALAEGLDRTAAPQRARIMRALPGHLNRSEIAIDLKKLMAGKGADLPLKADDILFVPNSAAKNAGARAMEAAVQIGTGMAIYGRY